MPPILLDTQSLIWAIEDSPRLGKTARSQLINGSQMVSASYFSLLEMTFKTGSGKLRDLTDEAEAYLGEMDMSLLMPDKPELKAYKIFNSDNKDPFDNLLIVVAISHKLILMTSDRKILATKARGLKLLDATK